MQYLFGVVYLRFYFDMTFVNNNHDSKSITKYEKQFSLKNVIIIKSCIQTFSGFGIN